MRHRSLILAILLLAAMNTAPLAVQADGGEFTPAQVRRIKENAYSKGNKLTPAEANEIYEYARQLEKNMKTEESRAFLNILIKTEHANASTYCLLASTYSDTTGAFSSQSARKYLQKALQLDSDCSKAYVALAEIDLVEGLAGQAMKNAQKAVACKTVDDSAYLMLATVQATNKQYKEALSNIEKAEKAGDVGGQLFRVKAGCMENMGRIEEAVTAYRKSFALQQKDWTQFQIVRCLETQKKYSEAIGELDKAIKKNPADGEAFRMRANLKLKNNDKVGALKDLDRCIDLEPTVKSYKERAKMHKVLGHEDLARKDLAEADRLMNSPF